MICYNLSATQTYTAQAFLFLQSGTQSPTYHPQPARDKSLRRFGVATRMVGRALCYSEAGVAYNRRSLTYRKHWKEIVSFYGSMCFWCREEVATCIDHVVPYSWDYDNDIENLVPSCMMCNAIAGNKMFESVEHKRRHILKRRADKRRRAILRCSECLVPFVQYEHSPSPFLCAHCYDLEYGTHEEASKSWRMWLALLDAADIPYLAHQEARKKRTAKNRRQFAYAVLTIIEQWEDDNDNANN